MAYAVPPQYTLLLTIVFGYVMFASCQGVIDEPYYGSNPALLRWVALSNWTYSRGFIANPDMLSANTLQLVCMGLDTVADVQV